MKQYYSFAFVLFLSYSGMAQTQRTIQPDSRLYAVFEQDYVNRLAAKSPAMLERYNLYLTDSYLIQDIPVGKAMTESATVNIPDLSAINILQIEKQQNLKRNKEGVTVYRIAGTDKILVLLCEKDFVRIFNKKTGRTVN
jgi:hypothetical protein